jgi:hypothetical protein
MVEFPDYKSAADHQLREWAAGRPWHNPWLPGATEPKFDRYGGECCPDFSCCFPAGIWARERRYEFVAAKGDKREGMMMGALGGMVGPDVHIADKELKDG